MSEYQRILVAVDVYSDYEAVINRAKAIAQSADKLHLVFVTFPTTYIQPYIGDLQANYHDTVITTDHKRTFEVGEAFNIPREQIHTRVGDIADEVHALANDIDADLIVVGTHGRSGWKVLLGSTANSILHGVKQDVLAVRVYSDEE